MNTVQYKFSPAGVQCLPDGVFIPQDMGNKDWVSYLDWVAKGGKTQPLSTAEDDAGVERRWRDGEVEAVKWLRERHRDEVELGGATSLTVEQYGELLGYMQSLRDWPQASNFPDAKHRPIRPAWIDQQPT